MTENSVGSCWQDEVQVSLRSVQCPQRSGSVKLSSLFSPAVMQLQADTPLNAVCTRAALPQGQRLFSFHLSLSELSSLTSLCLNCHPSTCHPLSSTSRMAPSGKHFLSPD